MKEPSGHISILPEDMANLVIVDGKRRITVERVGLGFGYNDVGEIVRLTFPDDSQAIGEIIESEEVPRTMEPRFANPQFRMVIEERPD